MVDIAPEMMDEASSAREAMLDAATNFDDNLMELVMEGKEAPAEQIIAALRKATIAQKIVPVLCGTAFKNKGVQPLLDAVVHFLPAPNEVPAIDGTDPKTGEPVHRESTDEASFSALAFKIMSDPFVGQLTFFRVYSGVLRSGDFVMNVTKGKRERIGRILRMHANKREEIKEVYAGNIAAAVGLKTCTTGDTLAAEDNQIVLESMEFPNPVIEIAIEPKTKADSEKMGVALGRLAAEDPSFRVATDEETGQTIIKGMGELHLEIIVDRMKREFKVEANVGKPQVAYRETITQEVEAEGKYVRQTGGRGQYGHVWLRLIPGQAGTGYVFEDGTTGGSVPKEFIKPASQGIAEALQRGIVAGFPMVDVKVVLFDGSAHDVDSSEMAFKIAGSMGLQEGAKRAKPILLEPVMAVEAVTPDEYLGNVQGDISRRRGKMGAPGERGNAKLVTAFVPLAEMFGYATDLRSMSKGRASYSMQFDHYEPVPAAVAEGIKAKTK